MEQITIYVKITESSKYYYCIITNGKFRNDQTIYI